jgi:hypothetical protein
MARIYEECGGADETICGEGEGMSMHEGGRDREGERRYGFRVVHVYV